MSKEITCDICGIKMGIQLNKHTTSFRFEDPHYSGFCPRDNPFDDVCCNCEDELRQTVTKTIDKLKFDASQEKAE